MKQLLTLISLVTLLAGCATTHKTNTMEDQKNQTENSTSPADTTSKVTGIGGIFFFSDNPQETKEWYTKNLGLEINEWGSAGFETRNIDRPEEINSLQWAVFKKGSDYFAPSKKEFMINYRVQNIEVLVTRFKESGITVVDSIATYDYGKFVHIMDAEGTKIELWEPMDEQKKEMETLVSTDKTTPKVTGIGGIFFYAEDPTKTKAWYTHHLGLEINEWGSAGFESRNVDKPDEINSLQWATFKKGDTYFSPSKKEFMINYRVQNIEGLVNKLKENGVTLVDSIASYDYGKFIHIMDPEGNKIELWEPVY